MATIFIRQCVVPLAGTWIETLSAAEKSDMNCVVPLAGTWIETLVSLRLAHETYVVPLAGTWIETTASGVGIFRAFGRSPCGNVD